MPELRSQAAAHCNGVCLHYRLHAFVDQRLQILRVAGSLMSAAALWMKSWLKPALLEKLLTSCSSMLALATPRNDRPLSVSGGASSLYLRLCRICRFPMNADSSRRCTLAELEPLQDADAYDLGCRLADRIVIVDTPEMPMRRTCCIAGYFVSVLPPAISRIHHHMVGQRCTAKQAFILRSEGSLGFTKHMICLRRTASISICTT